MYYGNAACVISVLFEELLIIDYVALKSLLFTTYLYSVLVIWSKMC